MAERKTIQDCSRSHFPIVSSLAFAARAWSSFSKVSCSVVFFADAELAFDALEGVGLAMMGKRGRLTLVLEIEVDVPDVSSTAMTECESINRQIRY